MDGVRDLLQQHMKDQPLTKQVSDSTGHEYRGVNSLLPNTHDRHLKPCSGTKTSFYAKYCFIKILCLYCAYMITKNKTDFTFHQGQVCNMKNCIYFSFCHFVLTAFDSEK